MRFPLPASSPGSGCSACGFGAALLESEPAGSAHPVPFSVFPVHLPQPEHILLPDGRSSVSVPLAAVLASVLCAHPRLIKALGRTQWSQEPGGLITGPALMFPKFRTDPGPRASVVRLFIFVPV